MSDVREILRAASPLRKKSKKLIDENGNEIVKDGKGEVKRNSKNSGSNVSGILDRCGGIEIMGGQSGISNVIGTTPRDSDTINTARTRRDSEIVPNDNRIIPVPQNADNGNGNTTPTGVTPQGTGITPRDVMTNGITPRDPVPLISYDMRKNAGSPNDSIFGKEAEMDAQGVECFDITTPIPGVDQIPKFFQGDDQPVFEEPKLEVKRTTASTSSFQNKPEGGSSVENIHSKPTSAEPSIVTLDTDDKLNPVLGDNFRASLHQPRAHRVKSLVQKFQKKQATTQKITGVPLTMPTSMVTMVGGQASVNGAANCNTSITNNAILEKGIITPSVISERTSSLSMGSGKGVSAGIGLESNNLIGIPPLNSSGFNLESKSFTSGKESASPNGNNTVYSASSSIIANNRMTLDSIGTKPGTVSAKNSLVDPKISVRNTEMSVRDTTISMPDDVVVEAKTSTSSRGAVSVMDEARVTTKDVTTVEPQKDVTPVITCTPFKDNIVTKDTINKPTPTPQKICTPMVNLETGNCTIQNPFPKDVINSVVEIAVDRHTVEDPTIFDTTDHTVLEDGSLLGDRSYVGERSLIGERSLLSDTSHTDEIDTSITMNRQTVRQRSISKENFGKSSISRKQSDIVLDNAIYPSGDVISARETRLIQDSTTIVGDASVIGRETRFEDSTMARNTCQEKPSLDSRISAAIRNTHVIMERTPRSSTDFEPSLETKKSVNIEKSTRVVGSNRPSTNTTPRMSEFEAVIDTRNTALTLGNDTRNTPINKIQIRSTEFHPLFGTKNSVNVEKHLPVDTTIRPTQFQEAFEARNSVNGQRNRTTEAQPSIRSTEFQPATETRKSVNIERRSELITPVNVLHSRLTEFQTVVDHRNSVNTPQHLPLKAPACSTEFHGVIHGVSDMRSSVNIPQHLPPETESRRTEFEPSGGTRNSINVATPTPTSNNNAQPTEFHSVIETRNTVNIELATPVGDPIQRSTEFQASIDTRSSINIEKRTPINSSTRQIQFHPSIDASNIVNVVGKGRSGATTVQEPSDATYDADTEFQSSAKPRTTTTVIPNQPSLRNTTFITDMPNQLSESQLPVEPMDHGGPLIDVELLNRRKSTLVIPDAANSGSTGKGRPTPEFESSSARKSTIFTNEKINRSTECQSLPTEFNQSSNTRNSTIFDRYQTTEPPMTREASKKPNIAESSDSNGSETNNACGSEPTNTAYPPRETKTYPPGEAKNQEEFEDRHPSSESSRKDSLPPNLDAIRTLRQHLEGFNRVKQENEHLKFENQKLRQENAELKKSSLLEENSTLKSSSNESSSLKELSCLKEMNSTLKESNTDLKEENTELKFYLRKMKKAFLDHMKSSKSTEEGLKLKLNGDLSSLKKEISCLQKSLAIEEEKSSYLQQSLDLQKKKSIRLQEEITVRLQQEKALRTQEEKAIRDQGVRYSKEGGALPLRSGTEFAKFGECCEIYDELQHTRMKLLLILAENKTLLTEIKRYRQKYQP